MKLDKPKVHMAIDEFVSAGIHLQMVEFPQSYQVFILRERGRVKYNHYLPKDSFTMEDAGTVFNHECDKIRIECF